MFRCWIEAFVKSDNFVPIKLLATLIIFQNASCYVSCSRGMALILYEEDMKAMNASIVKKNINQSEAGVGTERVQLNYYSLRKSGESYLQILNSTMMEILKQNDFVISFINGKESRILDEVLSSRNVKHFSLSQENCHLDYNGHSQEMSICQSFSSEVNKAMLLLLQHLQGSKMAILSSKDACSSTFSKNLLKEISRKNSLLSITRRTNVSYFEFSELPLDMKLISALLQKIKVFDPKVILLICPTILQRIVLQVAKKQEMFGYGDIWIIPMLDNTLASSLHPMQLVTISREVKPDQSSMLLNEQIITVVKQAMKIMDGSNESRKLLKANNAIQSLPCRSNKLSKVTVLAKTGKTSDWTMVYMKDQSNNFQFYANNGLIMGLFANNEPTAHLRVVTVIDAPFTMEVPYLRTGEGSFYQCERGILCRISITASNETVYSKNGTKWRYSCCIGHSMDLLNLLMERLRFSVDLYIIEDGFYGSLVNGSFNGMIGDVARGLADVAVAGLTITSLRSTAVDFTSPFIRQDIGIVTMSTKKELPFINWQFAYPIDDSVIIIVFAGIFFGTFLTYVMENQELVMKRLLNPKENPPRYPWREGFTYYSGLTFQRDLGGKNPSEFGTRVVAIGFAFAMLVIMTTYTAVLTATKVSQKDPNPFLGIKDQRMVNPTPKFKFATVPSTSIEGFFKDAPDENYRRMYIFMLNYNTRTVEEGLNQVKSGKLQAFIHEYPFLLYFLSKQSKCELQITGEPIGQSGFGLALPKGSSWTDRLSYEILRLKEAGTLTDLDKKWLSASCSEQSSSLLVPESLSLEYFGGLILFVAISFGVLFLMLPAEYAYRRYPRKPINALASRFASWKQTRQNRVSLKSRPKLTSISSESNFANLGMDMRPITVL